MEEKTMQLVQIKQGDVTRLRGAVKRRKKALMEWTDKFEQLEMLLISIEEMYSMRIGRLNSRDSMLDFEIIRFKKILELVKSGLTQEQAEKELTDNMRWEQAKWDSRWFELDKEFTEWEKKEQFLDSDKPTIKKLWKKLIHKFHPDLTLDPAEKSKRTEIMKKINIAYKNNDINMLYQIEEQEYIHGVDLAFSGQKYLEEVLLTIENAIIRIKNAYKNLKISEWYSWAKRTDSNREKVFIEMEYRIVMDIKAKENQIEIIKRQIDSV